MPLDAVTAPLKMGATRADTSNEGIPHTSVVARWPMVQSSILPSAIPPLSDILLASLVVSRQVCGMLSIRFWAPSPSHFRAVLLPSNYRYSGRSIYQYL